MHVAHPQEPAAARLFRFAPSPNGYLHRGHAYSALLNFRAAAATGGRFLLRIEDIDRSRARPEFEAAIYDDLAWLGLDWERPVLRQSERTEVYAAALAELRRLDLVYPAFLTRGEVRALVAEKGPSWPRDPDGAPLYPGTERDWPPARRRAEQAGGRPHVLRLDMRRALAGLPPLHWREADPFGTSPPAVVAADPAAWGDVVLARADAPASYHLAVVADDAAQQVSDVVRGRDLQPATAVHRLLQVLLGLPQPRYFHHRLLLGPDGRKLSKSRGSETLRARRAAGESREALLAALSPGMPAAGSATAPR